MDMLRDMLRDRLDRTVVRLSSLISNIGASRRAVTAKAELVINQVALAGAPVATGRDSSVVHIGDSHLRVFSICLLGSGGDGPRETRDRRGDRLAGKRCVVCRTLTESDAARKRIAVLP